MPGVVAGVLGVVGPLSAGVVGTVGVDGAVCVGGGVEVLGPLGPLGPFEIVPVGGVVAKRVFTPAAEPPPLPSISQECRFVTCHQKCIRFKVPPCKFEYNIRCAWLGRLLGGQPSRQSAQVALRAGMPC